jgi:hypothetical protein
MDMSISLISASDLEDLIAEHALFPEQRISTLLDSLREQEDDSEDGEDEWEEE